MIESNRMKIYHADSGLGVLIFTGLGGSLDGYQGKYRIIASALVEKYHASVFVVTVESWSEFDILFDAAMEEIEDYFNNLGKTDYRLYVMGSSAGGTMSVAKAYQYAQVQKVLAVNPVIGIYCEELLNGIEKSAAEMTLIFGGQDPSAEYVFLITDLIAKTGKDKVKVEILENVDHQFTQSFDLFLSLPEKYFFGG